MALWFFLSGGLCVGTVGDRLAARAPLQAIGWMLDALQWASGIFSIAGCCCLGAPPPPRVHRTPPRPHPQPDPPPSPNGGKPEPPSDEEFICLRTPITGGNGAAGIAHSYHTYSVGGSSSSGSSPPPPATRLGPVPGPHPGSSPVPAPVTPPVPFGPPPPRFAPAPAPAGPPTPLAPAPPVAPAPPAGPSCPPSHPSRPYPECNASSPAPIFDGVSGHGGYAPWLHN